jgi:hypothetical protein
VRIVPCRAVSRVQHAVRLDARGVPARPWLNDCEALVQHALPAVDDEG